MISLADAIESLRNDLREAHAKAATDIVFTPGPIEIELTVAFAEENAAGGGIKAYIFEASASTKGTETGTHRVKLSLSVADEKGDPIALKSASLPSNAG